MDYLQKIPIHPRVAKDEDDKSTMVAEGLKDIANTFNIPVLAVAAADRKALQGDRIRLFDLRQFRAPVRVGRHPDAEQQV